MKESVTKFNLEAAFKALDEIEIPVAKRGIAANKVNLKETFNRKSKLDLLMEDYYDVNDTDELEAAKEAREAEIAKAKLARIERIVDLNAETAEDLMTSYVGKVIIQCPQCMTLFYKDQEDIEKSEEDETVVNVNETCQHCGNNSGYTLVGKVDTVGEDEADNYDVDAFDENELDLDFDEPETEEENTEEVEEESTEDEDFDLDLTAEEGETEETEEDTEEEVKESLNEKFKGHVENIEELKDDLLKRLPESELWDVQGAKKDELHALMPGDRGANVISGIVNTALANSVLEAEVKVEKAMGGAEGWVHVAITGIKQDYSAMQLFDNLYTHTEDKETLSEAVDEATKEKLTKDIAEIDEKIAYYENQLKLAKDPSDIEDFNRKIDGFYKERASKQALIDGGLKMDNLEVETESLQEGVESELDDKLKAHNEYIEYLKEMIEKEEKSLANAKNDFVKKSIQSRIDALKADLEAALPEALKDEVEPADLPTPEEAELDATDNENEAESEENKDEEKPQEETKESLNESVVININVEGDKVAEEIPTIIPVAATVEQPAVEPVCLPEAECEVDPIVEIAPEVESEIPCEEPVIEVEPAIEAPIETEVEVVAEPEVADEPIEEPTTEEPASEEPIETEATADEVPVEDVVETEEVVEDELEEAFTGEKHTEETLNRESLLNRLAAGESIYIGSNQDNAGDEIVFDDGGYYSNTNYYIEQEADTYLLVPVAMSESGAEVSLEADLFDSFDEVYGIALNMMFDEINALVEEVVEVEKPLVEDTFDDVSDAEVEELFNSPEFNKPISDEEVEGYLEESKEFTSIFAEVEDLDEASIENCIKESLTEVYSNVDSFVVESCEMEKDAFKINGTIKFKSGNSTPTSYVFTEAKYVDEDKMTLKGINETLSKDGSFTLETTSASKVLFAESLSYSYKINNTLVEGLIKNNK